MPTSILLGCTELQRDDTTIHSTPLILRIQRSVRGMIGRRNFAKVLTDAKEHALMAKRLEQFPTGAYSVQTNSAECDEYWVQIDEIQITASRLGG
jgi:hypothetical protein